MNRKMNKWADRQMDVQMDECTGRKIDRLLDRQAGRYTAGQTGRLIDRYTNRWTEIQSGGKTGQQTNIQACKDTDGRMDRWTDNECTDIQMDG